MSSTMPTYNSSNNNWMLHEQWQLKYSLRCCNCRCLCLHLHLCLCLCLYFFLCVSCKRDKNISVTANVQQDKRNLSENANDKAPIIIGSTLSTPPDRQRAPATINSIENSTQNEEREGKEQNIFATVYTASQTHNLTWDMRRIVEMMCVANLHMYCAILEDRKPTTEGASLKIKCNLQNVEFQLASTADQLTQSRGRSRLPRIWASERREEEVKWERRGA